MLAFFGLDQAIFISYTPIMMMYDSYRIEELQKVKLYVFCGDPKKFFQGGRRIIVCRGVGVGWSEAYLINFHFPGRGVRGLHPDPLPFRSVHVC